MANPAYKYEYMLEGQVVNHSVRATYDDALEELLRKLSATVDGQHADRFLQVTFYQALAFPDNFFCLAWRVTSSFFAFLALSGFRDSVCMPCCAL